MASTLLNKLGWNRDAIERQLAHSERDGVRAAYNRAEFLPERRKMIQAWADYLDSLRDGAAVIPSNLKTAVDGSNWKRLSDARGGRWVGHGHEFSECAGEDGA